MSNGVAIHEPLQFYAGDTWEIRFACHQADGITPLDLTDAEIEWKLATADTLDQEPEVVFTATIGQGVTVIGDPQAGVCQVVIPGKASAETPSPNSGDFAPGYYRDQVRVVFPLSGLVTTQIGGRIQALAPL
jgi:hypothetical protein